jgi:hypothetical protein
MVAAGLDPGSVPAGDPSPTRQDCRTCHMIHETYTEDDFALRTTDAVAMYAVPGATYNGGMGNLCVNCHQPRRVLPVAVNDSISGISSHWGPHHGPQSAMMLGVAGGGVSGSPSGHYGAVQNTCVGCHLGVQDSHTFDPDDAVNDEGELVCQQCHPGADDFDIGNVQTEIEELGDQLGAALLARGLINENSEEGHPIVSKTEEDQAIALWNWLYVMHEDKSMGVHNPGYARALLEEGLDRLGLTPVAAGQASKRSGDGGSK